MRVHPFASVSQSSTYERQIVWIVRPETSSAVTVVNIYRLPSGSISQYLIELDDFLATQISSSTYRLILCGDFNCHGNDGTCINDGLQGVLDSFGLVFYISEPARAGNLDIIVSGGPGMVSEAFVDDAGLVSDQWLLHRMLRLNRPTSRPVVIKFQRLSKVDCTEFEGYLLRSSQFLNPAFTADAFADQLASIITEKLDCVAPLMTTFRRQSTTIN